MSGRTLFLAWQDKAQSRRWFPIGRLDAAVERPQYRFRYLRGAKQAREKAGFPLLIEFPELEGDYRSPELLSTMAVQIQTTDYHMVGWAPRYLVADLVKAMAESPEYSAQVVRVNPQTASSKQHVLIQMRGNWGEHEPMSGSEFRPLVT